MPRAYWRMPVDLDQTHPRPEDWVTLHCAAGRQPERGRFATWELLVKVIGAACAKRCKERGDVSLQPDGSWYVEEWEEGQEGDLTVGERMKRWRAKRAQRSGSQRLFNVTPLRPERNAKGGRVTHGT